MHLRDWILLCESAELDILYEITNTNFELFGPSLASLGICSWCIKISNFALLRVMASREWYYNHFSLCQVLCVFFSYPVTYFNARYNPRKQFKYTWLNVIVNCYLISLVVAWFVDLMLLTSNHFVTNFLIGWSNLICSTIL